MTKYRKRPVIIDAVQWKNSAKSWKEIQQMGDIPWKPGIMGEGFFFIETLEGDMRVNEGDYVIKGVNGEFYPCKPDIFEKTYEAVLF